MVNRNVQICILLTGVVLVSLGAFAQNAGATALGVNYYHETMMTDTWKTLYFPVSENQVREDMKDIKTISNHIKLYMNPFVDGNREWVSRVTDMARAEGLHVAVNLQVDDRNLDGSNWEQYRSRVMEACRTFNGRAGAMMVANEVSLHSPMSKYEIRSRVEPLIEECKTVFNGEVSYSGFWYEKEAWYDYKKPIYFNMYEHFDSYKTNVRELNQRWGGNARIGEWGEDLKDGNIAKDDRWQGEELEKRWNVIKDETNVPVAYIFSYREPSYDGFGIVCPQGNERPIWDVLRGESGNQPRPSEPEQPAPIVLNPSGSPVPSEPVPSEPAPSEPAPVPSEPVQGPAPNIAIMGLPVECEVESETCSVKSDSPSGLCRQVVFATQSGDINTYTCMKSDGMAETYVRDRPEGQRYKICIGSGCVSHTNGFASFDPYQTPEEKRQYESAPATNGIGSYKATCQVNEGSCSIGKDTVIGSCRTVEMDTPQGLLIVKACDKSRGIEVYRHIYPAGLDFEACIGDGCVNNIRGFDMFGKKNSGQTETEANVPPATGISSLKLSSSQGRIVNDFVESSGCRRVSAESSDGHAEVRICEKDSGHEMYRLSYSGEMDVCHNNSCVGRTAGFAKI
jgi:hypothetical protein